MTSPTTFPSDFVWGAATAAYQIEGASHEDGRSESIWDRFAATPGKVRNGDTGEIACDFYHRYRDDLGLMRELGLDAFRFSIAWPRVIPTGRGAVNAAGLDFYDRLVDDLLAAGIEPFATLYHWDLPQVLEDAGGWPVRETAEAFVEYTEAVVGRLGDRVRRWATHNEPWVVAFMGYGSGEHAPGRADHGDAIAASHHVLLSHGWAVEAIRRIAPGAQAGIVIDVWEQYPATDSPEDKAVARRADAEHNRWFLDPVLRGSYPDEVPEWTAKLEPYVRDGDLAAISAPLDFLGINNYSRRIVAAGPDGPSVVEPPGAERTEMGWEVYPDGLHDALVRVARDYDAPPLYVTENGAAFGDTRGHDGSVHDPERVAFLERYLGAVERAIADGAPVKGYFVWSLLDNFEWALGYSRRFGIVFIDYPTLERVPKDSFYWYRDFIAARRRAPEPSPAAPVPTG
ncbi:MAG TPA: GH1 family beta-glucosidase [Gaiellaceae bacterium]|nr:GH1 family beta-glucosidase [Gaiellaceae bacterium]